jgi:hypothetical protein
VEIEHFVAEIVDSAETVGEQLEIRFAKGIGSSAGLVPTATW